MAGSISVSMRARSKRASTGADPLLEIAICTGPRSTTAGTWKLESPGSSTILASTERSRAAAATA